MAFQKSYDSSLPITSAPCIHMRSKAIYVMGSLKSSHHPDEEGSGDCWCNKTQHIMGPDREIVARTVCTPGRSCYEETY